MMTWTGLDPMFGKFLREPASSMRKVEFARTTASLWIVRPPGMLNKPAAVCAGKEPCHLILVSFPPWKKSI